MKKNLLFLLAFVLSFSLIAQERKSLLELQQDFIDLKFGMFIHFNIPTFMNQDWADPDASPSLFNPQKMDCSQWAETAKKANMTYGCLTTKHHSGFCIWNTETTDYNVMNSPFGKDVVKEYVDAFRLQGLEVMLYYSILDTHHKLRPGFITKEHVELVKKQLVELLTNYGEIKALIIDGWDAPWSRISYDDIPFEDIYYLVKSIQPNCLIMDLNAAKYPGEALFYTDIKSYEQGAGQHISKERNCLPALSCLPINSSWFWKSDFPNSEVKSPEEIVNENIIPLNNSYCNFILNVAPNRDGLIDQNVIEALEEIGKLWRNNPIDNKLVGVKSPIISYNMAKNKPINSSWSNDMHIMDFANDDNFNSAWISNETISQPWLEVELAIREQAFNMITIAQRGHNTFSNYKLEYWHNNNWITLFEGDNKDIIKIHRFPKVWGSKVRIIINKQHTPPVITEFGVYAERL